MGTPICALVPFVGVRDEREPIPRLIAEGVAVLECELPCPLGSFVMTYNDPLRQLVTAKLMGNDHTLVPMLVGKIWDINYGSEHQTVRTDLQGVILLVCAR